MKFTEDPMEDKPIIIIEEKPDVIPGQGEGETPVIQIERGEEDTVPSVKVHRRWPWIAGSVAITILLCLVAFLLYRHFRAYGDLGVPISYTSEENIEKLKRPVDKNIRPEVILTTDSVLGVHLNFYELRGLRGEVTFQEPSPNDADVYLYSRCADQSTYDPTNVHYLGTLVMNGQLIDEDTERLGYCAMANGNTVIGIARDELMKDYILESGGSMFRQFILVSKNHLPSTFRLHGKVERRGIGRKDGRIYYIESINKETMWDFADALREYGFEDAIYITGGNAYSYYRTQDGQAHPIGLEPDPHRDTHTLPYMVFRRR